MKFEEGMLVFWGRWMVLGKTELWKDLRNSTYSTLLATRQVSKFQAVRASRGVRIRELGPGLGWNLNWARRASRLLHVLFLNVPMTCSRIEFNRPSLHAALFRSATSPMRSIPFYCYVPLWSTTLRYLPFRFVPLHSFRAFRFILFRSGFSLGPIFRLCPSREKATRKA